MLSNRGHLFAQHPHHGYYYSSSRNANASTPNENSLSFPGDHYPTRRNICFHFYYLDAYVSKFPGPRFFSNFINVPVPTIHFEIKIAPNLNNGHLLSEKQTRK